MAYKYTGLLGQPPADPFPAIDDPSYSPFDSKSRERVVAQARAQLNERIEALFKDCGANSADPEGWRKVALTLAKRHIRAFKDPPRPGRKKAVDYEIIFELHSIVQEGQSVKNAARILLKRRGKADEKRAAALETAYYRELRDYEQSSRLVARWSQQKLKIN